MVHAYPVTPTQSINQALGHQQMPLERATLRQWATAPEPSPLENVTFVLAPSAIPVLCDPPGMPPLPIKKSKRLNPRNDFLWWEKGRTHPLFPNLLFRLGHPHLEPLVFLLPRRLQHLAQYSRADPQIRCVLPVEDVIRLEVVDLRARREKCA